MVSRFDHERQRRRRISALAAGCFCALLLLPGLACLRLARSVDPRVLFGYRATASLLTFWLCGHDKRRAETGGWRTSESTLHLVEMLGGWPGAFLAQRFFRHKISKTSYQIAFWAIVVLHEAVSVDFLANWRYSQMLLQLVQTS